MVLFWSPIVVFPSAESNTFEKSMEYGDSKLSVLNEVAEFPESDRKGRL